MSIQLHHEHDNLFRVDVSGALRRAELQLCERQIVEQAQGWATVRLLFVLHDFEGWDVRDNWRDLTFYRDHGDAIERIAIVGDERWKDLALMFAVADLRRAPVEFFANDALADARGWLDR